jgi:hypothetical protein
VGVHHPYHARTAVLTCLSCFALVAQGLPDADVVRVLWVCIMRSVNLTGKNQAQILQTIIAKVKAHHKLLATFVTNAKLELTLLVTLQVRLVHSCIECWHFWCVRAGFFLPHSIWFC